MDVTSRFATVLLAIVLGAGAAACGGDPSSPAPAPVGPPSAPAAAPAGKVSANTASEDELVTALQGAGVPNAEKWAGEIEEYRPYPPDDPNLTKLRTELAKYEPGPGVVDKIVATLQP